jgi:uncharacterized iron-regulated membrane protein
MALSMSTTRTVGAPTKRPVAATGMAVRLLARRLHFLAGIVVAPFLLVLCLTGLVYVFSPQIHASLYHAQLYVADVGGIRRPVAEQVAAALTAHPEGRLAAVITPSDVDRTTRVVLSVPGSRSRAVFVDPYTNYINGELTTTGSHLLPANTWLRQLHGNLHLGEPGRIYAELAASWLPLIIVGGLVLWLAQPRRRKRVTARELLLPSFRGAGWSRLRGVHGPLGLWLAAGLLVGAVSALAMSQFAGGRADRSTDPSRMDAPTLAERPVPVPGADAKPVGIDRAIAASGLTGELLVTPPSGPGDVYTVAERSSGLPIRKDSVAIDPYTAEVTERVGWRDYSPAAKVRTLGAEFHTGTLFGLANQIVVTLLAIGLVVLIVLGYRMWWVKNPYQSRWSQAPPPTWRQLPRQALLLGLAVVAALTWMMPVFGASLAVFVAADAVLRRVAAKRS